MDRELTFEQLPSAVSQLNEKLESIEKLLLSQSEKESQKEQEEKLLNVEETAVFLSLSVATIYSKVSRRELPFMKRGKRLYFSKNGLLEYLREGKVKSNGEIEDQAEDYLVKKKGGKP